MCWFVQYTPLLTLLTKDLTAKVKSQGRLFQAWWLWPSSKIRIQSTSKCYPVAHVCGIVHSPCHNRNVENLYTQLLTFTWDFDSIWFSTLTSETSPRRRLHLFLYAQKSPDLGLLRRVLSWQLLAATYIYCKRTSVFKLGAYTFLKVWSTSPAILDDLTAIWSFYLSSPCVDQCRAYLYKNSLHRITWNGSVNFNLRHQWLRRQTSNSSKSATWKSSLFTSCDPSSPSMVSCYL